MSSTPENRELKSADLQAQSAARLRALLDDVELTPWAN